MEAIPAQDPSPESAGSSPSKSPSKQALRPSAAPFTFGAGAFPASKFSPVKQRRAAAPTSPEAPPAPSFLQGVAALPAPSDAFPNLEDGAETSNATGGWQIPALRPEEGEEADGPAAASPRAPASPRKPGAAAKIGRREAWMKFLAYEGAVQICLDSMLRGTSAPATGFLVDGCRQLKEALALGPLLLPDGGTSSTETAIYWDDREEGGGAVIERVTLRSNPAFAQGPAPVRQSYAAPPLSPQPRREATTPPVPGMTPLGNAQAQRAAAAAAVQASIVPRAASESGLPTIEATVVRVVGCPMLGAAGSDVSGSLSLRRSLSISRSSALTAPAQRLAVAMHPAGVATPEEARAWTGITPSGATEPGGGALRLLPDSPRGTLMVELYAGDRQVAAGTVQAAELQRCALQHDALDEEAPMAAGFLRNLMPGFGKRRDGGGGGMGAHSAAGHGPTPSMAWVRLVDAEGADAGHVVVAAKLVPRSEATTSSAMTISAAPSPGLTPTSARPPRPPAVSASISGPNDGVYLRPSAADDLPALPAPTDNGFGHLQRGRAAAERHEAAEAAAVNASHAAMPTEISHVVHVRGAGVGGRAHTSGGYLHVNAQHVYDVLLEAALTAAGCGPSRLLLGGPWSWLAERHAQRYGVRRQYATLAYLRWVVRQGNAAPTAACLGVLAEALRPLLDERDSVALQSAELALLGHVLERVDQLLTSCFENYFALSEETPGGLAEGMLSVRAAGAPPALTPAVALLEMTRGVEAGPDGGVAWLASRLRSAARKRFQALLAATEARRGPADRRRAGPDLGGGPSAAVTNEADDPAMVWAYSRVEELCSAVINELRADESIASDDVLPPPLVLPAVTSVEYIRGSIAYLNHVLDKYPPPAPSPAAVSLVEAVGQLQGFVERHGFEAAAARLNSKDIFGGFVSEWVASTAGALRRTLRALDRVGPPALAGWADLQTGVKTRVSPLVEGMLSECEAEMKRYARIVAYWPAHGQDLEAALVAVLREATAAASGQCGLVQTKVDEGEALGAGVTLASPRGGPDGRGFLQRPTGTSTAAMAEGKRLGRVAWRWVQVGSGGQGSSFADAPPALRRGISPHQALLLNSLRRLLAVVPQLELALHAWCAGGPSSPTTDPARASMAQLPPGTDPEERLERDAPDLGAHWAQLVKEVRTEYFACCTLTVESLAGELSRAPATSVLGVLRREAAPAGVTKALRKALEATAPCLRWLAAALDGRVFVALGRGLWDSAAKDLLRFAEDLSDASVGAVGGAQGAWRARQGAAAALRSLDAFYRTELAAAMGSDLLDKDLTPPQHAQRAAALLADNSVEVNQSFDVY